MHIVMFYHSLLSDWNHGNAHFLRGVGSELIAQGHEVDIYEPEDSWSLQNLIADFGYQPIDEFKAAYPGLSSKRYQLARLDLDKALYDADLVIVHEWNDHELVRHIGEHHKYTGSYKLLFHDTHHRSVTDSESMSNYDLSNYDGVLAFGSVIRDLYISKGWAKQAWTWHEAADIRVFKPANGVEPKGDLVWIGNWGDDERTAELHQFLLQPVKELNLKARIYGVRYPEHALSSLRDCGIQYGNWLPNYRVPEVFMAYKATVHVPRRPYVKALPGIPTIRVFEALACGIPLVTAPWDDIEGLFTPGKDFLVANNSAEMKDHLRMVIEDRDTARELSEHGLKTILERHTCHHRVNELMNIYSNLEANS